MGKALKWFRGMLGLNKKRWSFPKGKLRRRSHAIDDKETSRQAIAVAEAAVAHGATYCSQNDVVCEEPAAVVIQSHFRGHLSRRALRALKALVKLQALVRGHILRKHNAETLRQLQALMRAQARARAGRLPTEESTKPSLFNHTEKADHATKQNEHESPACAKMQRKNTNLVYDPDKSPSPWMERRKGEKVRWDQGAYFTRIARVDEEKGDKVVEVDTGRPSTSPTGRTIIHISDHHTTWLSPSLSPLTVAINANGSPFYTANNSPAYSSSVEGSSKRALFAPAKSSLSNCTEHPSYMAYTESSKAKARSLSAPKQRPQSERSSSPWER
ncbi:hypothetical protein SASPL_133353 [Salvia splendens]|uniref:DUF4005 domain-containing protein n=1 Tax=Salvia splendens TaxID=180675 RepID=A0A8X8X444_SALSN|nr:protein IQ-DOMAIN 17-like [Salvia splendens]KAG6405759.1 hypothetical protein SASPL_133353 [Salvia splendens]